jgi:putative flippase GtrA
MIMGLLKNKISTQFYKFIVVGVWSTIINYGIFYILLEFLNINYLISSAVGFISGVFAGYGFNRKWTFKVEKKKKYTEIIKYYTVYIVSLILSLLFLKIIVDAVGVDPRIANILAIGLTTCTNFIGIKIVVFK